MKDLFKLKSPTEVLEYYRMFMPLPAEMVPLAAARDRVLAENLLSPENLPPFSRSTMDGFAVRAKDIAGCSESEPALLNLIGEIRMGVPGSSFSLCPGQAVQIWTGGELPPGADSVVMVECTRFLSDTTLAVHTSVGCGENVIAAGEDYRQGEAVLEAGHLLRPQDLGILSGLGLTEVKVCRRPQVAILSTGDELVPASSALIPGKIRDINSTTLRSLVEEAGGIPHCCGICGDVFDNLCTACSNALSQADILLLSGGSSAGRRDYTLKVFEALDETEILLHGISGSSGKSTIFARRGNRALFGLPGHAASAMVIFYFVVRPLIRLMTGLGATHGLRTIQGVTAESISSVPGREEYLRVRLRPAAGGDFPLIEPVYGRSGLLSPLVGADGFLSVGRDVEGLDKGAVAQVLLFPGYQMM